MHNIYTCTRSFIPNISYLLPLTILSVHHTQVLHIQLDNTTAENKNLVMVSMASWLVKSGKVKRVRVFFLLVGHTHIIIDQIFGVITVRLRRSELLTPADLIDNIERTLADNLDYLPHDVQVIPLTTNLFPVPAPFVSFPPQVNNIVNIPIPPGSALLI